MYYFLAMSCCFSRFVTLEPGDIVLTGTPPGVGCFRKPPLYLKVSALEGVAWWWHLKLPSDMLCVLCCGTPCAVTFCVQ